MNKQITLAYFEERHKEQNEHNTIKSVDLKQNEIHTITDYRCVETSNGEAMILTSHDETEVWATLHLKSKIEQTKSKNKELPYYVRQLGLKPCKKNKKNKYHAFEFVY